MYQKARLKWLGEGDANTSFFQASIRIRRRHNNILALRCGDAWVEGVQEIKETVTNHFQEIYSDSFSNRPRLDGLHFNQISAEDNLMLAASFSEEEIREAVWSCDGGKSPGPDGFNFNFIKSCWDFLHKEVCDLVQEFYTNGKLPRGVSSSFVALIPKNDNPQTISEYRPICLIGCIYKIISKLLALRLKKVLGGVISTCQSAFLPNRQILDGVVVVNEVVDLAKRANKSCFVLKVDFEKAYDYVSWSYLEYMFERMGFCEKWRVWMHACICSGSFSVLINGSPTKEVHVAKGLRQGDPLAPFLFLIAVEGLSALVSRASELGLYHGFKVGGEESIALLQYADDTILLGEANWDNLCALKSIMRGFELVSGLKVNFLKSSLMGVNVDEYFLNVAASFLFCSIGKVPFKFLGLPVGANPRRVST